MDAGKTLRPGIFPGGVDTQVGNVRGNCRKRGCQQAGNAEQCGLETVGVNILRNGININIGCGQGVFKQSLQGIRRRIGDFCIGIAFSEQR